jgi:hypothetical protein
MLRGLIAISTGVLAVNLIVTSRWPGALLAGAVGLWWLLDTVLRKFFWPSFAFLLLLGANAAALSTDFNAALALFSVVTALMAWDLDQLQRRLPHRDGYTDQLVLAHLKRTSGVGLVGLMLGGLALAWHFELTLGWALFIGFLFVSALILTLRWGGRAAG